MAKIKILSEKMAKMISAGEVVEKPASIVKELVENSIDAGATSITVEIVNGGQTSIVISDNGHGMNKDDIYLSILPHATSKIEFPEDLNAILTLGFRGEALSSISAVSEVSIMSKTVEQEYGYLVYFFEKACAMSAYLLGVNPFDQPGVESYKNNMFVLLGKPGYEDKREKLLDRLY